MFGGENKYLRIQKAPRGAKIAYDYEGAPKKCRPFYFVDSKKKLGAPSAPSLSKKMATADGPVSRDEVNTFPRCQIALVDNKKHLRSNMTPTLTQSSI